MVGTTENGPISAHMCAIDKYGVPKEAQDDAPSYDTSGGRQTPPQRPTGGDDGASGLSPTAFGYGPLEKIFLGRRGFPLRLVGLFTFNCMLIL